MTLREKIFKTFLVTIREINTHGGPEKFFEKYPVGGMYYGEGHALVDEIGREVGTQMTYEKLLECKRYAKNKLWVCADGCQVRGQRMNNNIRSLAATPYTEEDAYEYGKVIGMQLNDKGVDCVLGPAIDMCFDHSTVWGLTNDPELVVKLYRQVIRGIRDQGVCATAKHFPGMGSHHINMHLAPGQNIFPFDRWMDTYGYTYREMFKEDVDSVMTTHIALKSYDNETHDGFYPIATFSEKLTTELLKDKLGFQGAVITDALIMGGMATGDLIAETVQAFKAGADFLLWPPVEAAEVIEEKILSGEIPMSRLDDALARIERMENFRNQALAAKTYDTPDAAYADETMKRIIANGMCLLRNDIDLLPLDANKYKSVLIVNGTEQDDSTACKLLKTELESRGITADIARDIYDVPSNVCWQDDIDLLQAKYDLVLFHMNAEHSIWSTPLMIVWASHLFDKRKKLIINYGTSHFVEDYFPEDPTIVQMNCTANAFSVKALVDRLLGTEPFIGKSCLI